MLANITNTQTETRIITPVIHGQRVTIDELLPFAAAVIDSVGSEHSKRAYERSLKSFFEWFLLNNEPELCKATIQRYIDEQRGKGLGAVTINQRLTAVRNLVKEAVDNGVLDATLTGGILRIKGERKEGKRLGNWLTKSQAQALLNAPNITTPKGLRDRAMLAVLIGCALRRDEAAHTLTFEHIQQVEGHWAIVDLVGKRNKTRSVPMPSWVKAAIDAWAAAAGISSGPVFRSVNKGGRVSETATPSQTVYELCEVYGPMIGKKIAPHDLRRTCAKLMWKTGGDLLEIQRILGHASAKTTEIYIGAELNFTDPPNDRLGLSLSAD